MCAEGQDRPLNIKVLIDKIIQVDHPVIHNDLFFRVDLHIHKFCDLLDGIISPRLNFVSLFDQVRGWF